MVLAKASFMRYISSSPFFLGPLRLRCWMSVLPIPGEDVVVHLVDEVEDGNPDSPHSEGTVAVDGVFLEVTIHLVGI